MEFFAGFDPDLRGVAEHLAAAGTPLAVPRGTHLLEAGAVADRFYFLHRGAVRNYLPGERGGATTWLTLEGDLVTATVSLSSGAASREAIEALEDCALLAFARADLERAYRRVPGAERLGRLVVEHYFGKLTHRLYDNAIKSARDRYAELLALHPEIVARVPLGVVASYLHMTPETLSRVRRVKSA